MERMEQNDIIIYNTDDGKSSVVLVGADGMVWLNQLQMAELFATSKQSISYHITNILKEKELPKIAVVKNILTTASDGKQYMVEHYSLDMVLAVGYRVKGVRGIQFRQWATRNLSEYLVKGFVIDSDRLKNPDGRPDYFDELLSKIRDIRASEKRFYQKLRELFALSSDYDASDKAVQMFFAETQNKLLYAVTNHTAAELIMERADAGKPLCVNARFVRVSSSSLVSPFEYVGALNRSFLRFGGRPRIIAPCFLGCFFLYRLRLCARRFCVCLCSRSCLRSST